jgi:hypothetical protein
MATRRRRSHPISATNGRGPGRGQHCGWSANATAPRRYFRARPLRRLPHDPSAVTRLTPAPPELNDTKVVGAAPATKTAGRGYRSGHVRRRPVLHQRRDGGSRASAAPAGRGQVATIVVLVLTTDDRGSQRRRAFGPGTLRPRAGPLYRRGHADPGGGQQFPARACPAASVRDVNLTEPAAFDRRMLVADESVADRHGPSDGEVPGVPPRGQAAPEASSRPCPTAGTGLHPLGGRSP